MDLLALYRPNDKDVVIFGNLTQFMRLASEIADCREMCEFRLNPTLAKPNAYSDYITATTLQIRVWEKYLREVVVDVDEAKLILSGDDNEFRVLAQEIRDLCDVVRETESPSHFHIEYCGGLVGVTPNTWATVIDCDPEDAM